MAPDLNYKILGIMPRGTWPSIVTSMTHVHGTEPSGSELNHYMATTLGFKEEGGNAWLHPSGLAFGDVHTGNFLRTPDERMVPIDLTVDGEPKDNFYSWLWSWFLGRAGANQACYGRAMAMQKPTPDSGERCRSEAKHL